MSASAGLAGVPLSRRWRALYAGRAHCVTLRNFVAAKGGFWVTIASGFFEPVFYLLAMGIGLGHFVGDMAAPNGRPVSYAAFIAPALLATSAMNGAIYDSTWNVFGKLKHMKTYRGMLNTSLGPLDLALGEIGWALLRGLLYAVAFLLVMLVMGLIHNALALLALPAVALIAYGFAALGMSVTSHMSTYQQMDWIGFVLLPMFILSATFFPITVYPRPVQLIIEVFPLWHAVDLVRNLTLGSWTSACVVHVAYFVALAAVGTTLVTRRLRALFMD